MKKKSYLLFLSTILIISSFGLVASQQTLCDLDATLINQDPYPAIPGELVKVVFQIVGTSDSRCETVTFQLIEEFPFTLEGAVSSTQKIEASTFVSSDFASFWLVPYNVIIDAAALDGENTIKVQYGGQGVGTRIEEFNITIENLLGDFEVSIKDYVADTNTLTFEILNIGEADVEALTIDIPKQPNIEIKGSKRNIVGSLDSKEDTTFTFEAIPKDGEIKLAILYTDEINERRTIEKIVIYDSAYFTDRARDKNGRSPSFYILIILIVVIVVYWFYKRWKKKKAKHKLRHSS